jgi:hypothetical protein
MKTSVVVLKNASKPNFARGRVANGGCTLLMAVMAGMLALSSCVSTSCTTGQACDECDNGNRSAVGWDMVLIQRPSMGQKTGWSAACRLKDAGVVNLFAPEGTNLVSSDLRQGDRHSIVSGEFDLVTMAAFIDVDHRSHVPCRQPMVGKVGGQRDAIQLFEMVAKVRPPQPSSSSFAGNRWIEMTSTWGPSR